MSKLSFSQSVSVSPVLEVSLQLTPALVEASRTQKHRRPTCTLLSTHTHTPHTLTDCHACFCLGTEGWDRVVSSSGRFRSRSVLFWFGPSLRNDRQGSLLDSRTSYTHAHTHTHTHTHAHTRTSMCTALGLMTPILQFLL